MDPESGLDAARNIAISNGKILAVVEEDLRGAITLDANGLVLAPGFIDMHSHGQDPENYAIQVRDGVTTALELEIGTSDIDQWYEERESATIVNYGASIGHVPLRMKIIPDPGKLTPVADAATRPATDSDIEEMVKGVDRGLKRGALAVGFGISYTPAASRWEILEIFRVASLYTAPCHVHIRGKGLEGLEEVIAASALTGAPLHVVHISSSGLEEAPHMLQVIMEARSRGMDITTECYPYPTAMTEIGSATFDEGWEARTGMGYEHLEWTETGERLTPESFARYRKQNGMVLMHFIPEDVVKESVASPITSIASDGFISGGKGHPRTAGTYTRTLGRFVRELGAPSLMDALRKMSLMPAQRLQTRAPVMEFKGRIKVGADADLVAFDPARVIDRATYREPTLPPDGMIHVLVNGTPVVRYGQLDETVTPGQAVRAPVEPSV